MADPEDSLPLGFDAEFTDDHTHDGVSTADATAITYFMSPSYPSLLKSVEGVEVTGAATGTGELTFVETANGKTLGTLDHAVADSVGDVISWTRDATAFIIPANTAISVDTTGAASSASGVLNLRMSFARIPDYES